MESTAMFKDFDRLMMIFILKKKKKKKKNSKAMKSKVNMRKFMVFKHFGSSLLSAPQKG
jgi:hypothetical protein